MPLCFRPIAAAAAVLAVSMGLAGCGASMSGLTTGSLFGSGDAAPAAKSADAAKPEPPKSDPTARALQVAATSARARKCGYYFDPARLKANYLAAEARAGLTTDALSRLDKEYDYTLGTIAKQLAENEDYCTEQRIGAIKESLRRHLAGDYEPPARRTAESAGGLFGDLSSEPQGREVLNPDWLKDPWEKKTKRVSE